MMVNENDYCKLEPYSLSKKQRFYVFIKRVLDFLASIVGIVLCVIPSLFIALAIKIEDGGPVFFKHKRIGRNGKEFVCVKFRSMSVNARHDIAGYQYSGVESQITKVGHFLRKTSLDELPQLISLFSGDMSLIGYRPSQKAEVELNTAREKCNLYQIRPGITGWAQVNGRDVLAAHPTLKAEYDAYYLRHISFKLDVKIFFMTIKSVFWHTDFEEGVVP